MNIKKFFDKTLLKFLVVGVLNTLFSLTIMFSLYQLADFGYWSASATAYILASILSFVLNRRFTFENDAPILKTAIKFTVNVAVCYLLAYSIAEPVVVLVMGKMGLSDSFVEQIAMLFGTCLFTALNYVGQRFFAFRKI